MTGNSSGWSGNDDRLSVQASKTGWFFNHGDGVLEASDLQVDWGLRSIGDVVDNADGNRGGRFEVATEDTDGVVVTGVLGQVELRDGNSVSCNRLEQWQDGRSGASW